LLQTVFFHFDKVSSSEARNQNPDRDSEILMIPMIFVVVVVVVVFLQICRKRNVCKIETTGDVYVVVAGVPEPQPDHAVRMTKFAHECQMMFNALTLELERQLGPETSDLKMRFGLSSGPVIGGVLLGGASKFHIFGEYLYGQGLLLHVCFIR
jgi:class 3 adenylate cyclase